MPVVFDNVIGEVEPVHAPAPEEPKTPNEPEEPGREKWYRELRRLAQREARLRAD